MPPCHPFRPVPGQCGPNRRGPLPAPPFDPRDYWATRKCVSQLSASLGTKLDKTGGTVRGDFKVDLPDYSGIILSVANGLVSIADGQTYFTGSGGQLVFRSDGFKKILTLDERGKPVTLMDFLDSLAWRTTGNRTLSDYGITDAVQFVTDSNGNKTAATIGSRKIGKSVGQYSLANGYNVTASGLASHAEGSGTTASGNYSHAEGEGTTASGYASHAEGEGTIASGYASHAEGVNARTLEGDGNAYAWNGDEDIQYTSHGHGTFNINPVGGLNGFYIGGQTLTQVINAVIAERLSAIDPDNASVYDLIKALKGE